MERNKQTHGNPLRALDLQSVAGATFNARLGIDLCLGGGCARPPLPPPVPPPAPLPAPARFKPASWQLHSQPAAPERYQVPGRNEYFEVNGGWRRA
jgi:hypothetical protein